MNKKYYNQFIFLLKLYFVFQVFVISAFFVIPSVLAQPLDTYRFQNLTIVSTYPPIISQLVTPNASYIAPNLSLVSSNNNTYVFNFPLRNLGMHKVFYTSNDELKESSFFVTHKNNPVSLSFPWYWIALIGVVIALIFVAFAFWTIAMWVILITGFILLSSDLSYLSASLGIIFLIYAGFNIK